MRPSYLLGTALVASALACGRVLDPPLVPSSIEVVTGNNQTWLAGQVLPSTPSIIVRDQTGAQVGGTPLTVVVTTGGGTIAGAPTVSAATGPTTLGIWTLGKVPGTNILTVTAGTVNKAFVATAIPGPAAKLVVKSGSSGITGTVGLSVTTNIIIQVLDETDNPVQGAPVSLIASDGGSAFLNSPASDANGNITVNRWFLGTVAGTQTLSISIGGIAPVTISAVARAGQAQNLIPNLAQPLRQFAGAPGTTALAVRAVDGFGNSVQNVVVTFAVRDGGGVITGATSATTGVGGVAAAGTWTLGRTFGLQSVFVSTTGANGLLTGQATSSYQASVRYVGTIDGPVQARVQTALDRLRMAVVGHVDDVPVAGLDLAVTCGVVGGGVFDEVVRDMIFYVQVIAIDGPGGTAVRGAPCLSRVTQTGQISVISIDIADLQTILDDGSFDAAVLREMVHGLGFGLAWNLSLVTGTTGPDPRFLGTAATAAFVAAGGTSTPGVPAENLGGAGVINVHWRSSVFGDELMTGFPLVGQLRPFSAITIQSLADIGYAVNVFAADPFAFAAAALRRP